MSKSKIIPVPYYQIAPYANEFEFKTSTYKPVPNKKIHWHCPFIVLDKALINKPIKDVAIAVADENNANNEDNGSNNHESSINENTAQATKDESSTNKTNEEIELQDKQRLDYLAHQEAKPENRTNNAKSFKTVKQSNPNLSNTQNTPLEQPNAEQPDPEQHNSNDIIDSKPTDKRENIDQAIKNQSSQPSDEITHNTNKLSSADSSSSDNQDINDSNSRSFNGESSDKDIVEDVEKEGFENEDSEQQDFENEDDEDEELSEAEVKKQEKESKLESYKQFIAEQQSKVDIDYQGVRVNIEANALPSRMYFIMNALSAIIASYGLVINSAAVVIGAMLVAMMLGPISGVALAIIDYRIPFLRKSLITVMLGGGMVIAIGYIVGSLHTDSQLTSEILSRTQPTSMDLMIALAGGTAGAYAMISPHLSVAVVGVAVATALVPPLAASGILFAHGETSLGFGAFLLALTNIIAIQFTNALVLWFTGFRRLVDDDYKSSPFIAFIRRNAVPLILLTGIAIYLTYNFDSITKKQQFENTVENTINDYFSDKGNALTTTQFVPREDYQTVRAVIRGETRPTADDVNLLEKKVNNIINEDFPKYQKIRLQIRYMPIEVIEANPNRTDDISQTDVAILSKE